MRDAVEKFLSNMQMWILPALVVLGLVLTLWHPIELESLLAWGEDIGTSWWFLLLTMAVIALMFTFGLPGSFGLWLIAPFNPPLLSTLLLVISSTAGSLGAYYFAVKMGGSRAPTRATAWIMDTLAKRGSMLTLLAMRMLPGFPHSVINFASGVLKIPMRKFLTATILGLIIKWGVYSAAVYGVTEVIEGEEVISMGSLYPLFALVVLALAGAWARRRMGR